MKIHQSGSHLTDKRGARVEDWSWAQTKRRLTALYRLARDAGFRGGLADLLPTVAGWVGAKRF